MVFYCNMKGSGITEKKRVKHNKAIIGIIIFLCILLTLYFGAAVYFMDHFYIGTQINSVSVSGKTVEEVKEQMAAELKTYTLTIIEQDGKNEKIKAADIGLKYSSNGEYKKFKEEQSPFKWVSAFFNTDASKIKDEMSYDSQKLKKRIEKLDCLDSSKVIEPKDATLKYEKNNYVIVGEVEGNKVDKEALLKRAAKAIENEETSIDLEKDHCYIHPEVTSKSPKMIEAKDSLNKYVGSKITYTFNDGTENIDCDLINKWLKVDENLQVTIDEGKMKKDLGKIFSPYSTVGKNRNFTTSAGSKISIGGGDYGWQIDTKKETEEVKAAIQEGKTVTKEPAYQQKAMSKGENDIGNTYVEINLTKQHLWFYKNGALVTEGDVVTGDMNTNHATPDGIYKLKYKEKDTVLKGADYNAPVNFWMPFNGGIGIHDASWRSEFGGEIYKTGGSHGCINAPYSLAQAVFSNIEAGTPVICYN